MYVKGLIHNNSFNRSVRILVLNRLFLSFDANDLDHCSGSVKNKPKSTPLFPTLVIVPVAPTLTPFWWRLIPQACTLNEPSPAEWQVSLWGAAAAGEGGLPLLFSSQLLPSFPPSSHFPPPCSASVFGPAGTPRGAVNRCYSPVRGRTWRRWREWSWHVDDLEIRSASQTHTHKHSYTLPRVSKNNDVTDGGWTGK